MGLKTTLLLSLALSGATLWAQEEPAAPAPPKELKKFDRMIGTWAGSGTATMAPGMEASPWTSMSRTRPVMNGFFLEEVTVIDVGPMLPAPLVFRSFFGFDTQTKRYLSCAAGNMGGVSTTRIHWADDDTMISVESGVEEGNVVVDRWVTNLGTDSYSFFGHRAVGAGEFFIHVSGEMKRTDEPFKAPALETVPGLAPASAEMQKLNRMAGSYRFKGSLQMMPDVPVMDISGTEELDALFGGGVLQASVKGDPMPLGAYEGWSAIAWSPDKDCYTTVFVNNMGEIGEAEMRWVGDQLVSTGSMLRMGQPSVMRGTLDFDEQGVITKVEMHSLVGTAPPMRDFEATYKKLK